MLKKTLLFFILFSTLILHAELIINSSPPNDNGAITLEIPPGQNALIHDNDWVGVYKKGTSTEWKNVIIWKWVREFKLNRAEYRIYSDILAIKEAGEYEVRYFKNNSFTTYKAFNFILKGNSSPVSSLYYDDEQNNIAIVGFIKDVTQPNPTDWIGIYPKGSNNDWNNVIEWRWAKDSFPSGNQQQGEIDKRYISLDISQYQTNTQYEARYFLNNSFVTYKKSKPFSIKIKPLNFFRMTAFAQKNTVTVYLVGSDGYLRPNPKDWIAIYKKGSSNDWNNVLAWMWAKDVNIKVIENSPHSKYDYLKIKLQQGEEYEIRYFLNNSFTTYERSPVKML